ncbi:hypothetical protein QQF64_032813 [Cirrhinus molitorella]|uniref:Uncharacterized protein n=1 Tax=Cirrhinus molitorella TaxID=172907 RepID=A0ABR3MS31_9TELE
MQRAARMEVQRRKRKLPAGEADGALTAKVWPLHAHIVATEAVCASSQLPSQTCSSPQPAVPLCPLSARRQCPRYRSKRSASVFIQPWVQRSNPEAGTFPDTCSFTASYQSTV